MNIFLGILITLAGGISIYYARFFEKWFSRWDWAEKYLGGTAQGYVIIGFMLMVLGLLGTFGVVDLAK